MPEIDIGILVTTLMSKVDTQSSQLSTVIEKLIYLEREVGGLRNWKGAQTEEVTTIKLQIVQLARDSESLRSSFARGTQRLEAVEDTLSGGLLSPTELMQYREHARRRQEQLNALRLLRYSVIANFVLVAGGIAEALLNHWHL